MKRISNIDWTKYKKVITDFLDNDSGLKPIIWLKALSQPLPHGEDVGSTFLRNDLNVLVGYNVYRTWPINKVTQSGELDNETCYIMISKTQLSEKALLDSNGYFKFDITRDRFIIDGIPYKSSGDTVASQASDEELFTMVILKRLAAEKPTKYTIIENP